MQYIGSDSEEVFWNTLEHEHSISQKFIKAAMWLFQVHAAAATEKPHLQSSNPAQLL